MKGLLHRSIPALAAGLLLWAILIPARAAGTIDVHATSGGHVTPSVGPDSNCHSWRGGNCYRYDGTIPVELIAAADPGYEFTGWSGDCQGLGFCTVTTDWNRHVSAQFRKQSQLRLHDTSYDVREVLEYNQLQGSCDRWSANPAGASQYLTLMCGKWLFFYGGFDIPGVPAPLIDFMTENLPDTVGAGFAKFGMIADPYSRQGRPLGLAPGATVSGLSTLSFTCASCHAGKTADGRYSAGLANHDYDYGKQILATNFTVAALLPQSVKDQMMASQTQAYMAPIWNEIATRQLQGKLMMSLLPLLPYLFDGNTPPLIPPDIQLQYLAWKPGTQDFIIIPVGADDHIETVSKILPLWNLYSEEQMQAAGGPHAMLGFTGSTPSYDHFLDGFVALSLGNFPKAQFAPLEAYLLSLKAPPSLQVRNPSQVAKGKTLFTQAGCDSCHNGPSHAGTRIFSFDEIGTDAAMKYWADGDEDGVSDVPAVISDPLSEGIKAPRLVGLWAQKRLLHNGSVDSLEDLFCLDHARPTRTDQPFGDEGHMMSCDGLSDDQKQDLIAYLKSL